MKQDITKEIEIPQGIAVQLEANIVIVKGKKGEINRTFKLRGIKIEKQDSKIIFGAEKATRYEKKILGTIVAHIKNMIFGVENGFEYKLQICSVHFPITVHIDAANHIAIIKNFLGEVKERKAKLLEGVDVQINGDIITINSIDKEKAGQTALNIEKSTRVRAKDRRVFQDGIFMIEKAGDKI